MNERIEQEAPRTRTVHFVAQQIWENGMTGAGCACGIFAAVDGTDFDATMVALAELRRLHADADLAARSPRVRTEREARETLVRLSVDPREFDRRGFLR